MGKLKDYGIIRKRDDLPELERAVSDTLDEYLYRLHGSICSWAHPFEFIDWLYRRGYKIERIKCSNSTSDD